MTEIAETTGQICPACGCRLGESPYKKGKVLYCCESCATGGQCGCGCCEVVEAEE